MFVKISETYDLSTVNDKLGLIGIHTPDGKALYTMWRGYFMNFRKYRFVSCDVNMACASMLPADPLQVGVEAGDIAPQDMFNPILYKACSNDSMSNLLNRLYGGQGFTSSDGIGPSVLSDNESVYGYDADSEVDQFAMYYGLLADTDGWKKAMPQSGVSMRGLKPLTFSILSSQGQPYAYQGLNVGSMAPPIAPNTETGSATGALSVFQNRFMRGPTVRMPSMPTYCVTSSNMGLTDIANTTGVDTNHTGTGDGDAVATPQIASNVLPNIDAPKCFVGAIIMPPAKLNRLYYRMKVTWTVEFTEPRPVTELTNWYGMAVTGILNYGSDYVDQTALIAKTSTNSLNGMVDTSEMDVKKIMDSSK